MGDTVINVFCFWVELHEEQHVKPGGDASANLNGTPFAAQTSPHPYSHVGTLSARTRVACQAFSPRRRLVVWSAIGRSGPSAESDSRFESCVLKQAPLPTRDQTPLATSVVGSIDILGPSFRAVPPPPASTESLDMTVCLKRSAVTMRHASASFLSD